MTNPENPLDKRGCGSENDARPSVTNVTSVDVTVVTYNSRAHLESLIEGLANQQNSSLALNLYVVDNASSDGTPEFLEEMLRRKEGVFEHVSISQSEANMGFARGQNQAVSMGAAPYLFILNPDAVPMAQCLERLVKTAEDDVSTAVAWEARQIPYEHPKEYDRVTLEAVWCSGAALLVRRSAFEQIAGFDSKIFMYCDDVDLSWRLRAAGFLLRYVPSATVRHRTYAEPWEVKPVQHLNSFLGNMYLRARFGNWRDICVGWCFYLIEIVRREKYPGQRLALLKNLFVYLRNFWHFRSSKRSLNPRPEFRRLDYALARTGAFHNVVPAPDLTQLPKVSILIRTVGRQRQLRRALNTVVNQTYPKIEVIIVEDGLATLSQFLKDFEIPEMKYKPLLKNSGRCVAGNSAMELATGEYFIFLDEDDEFYADHVEQLVAEIIRSNSLVAYATTFEVPTLYGADGEIVREGEYQLASDRAFSAVALCHSNYIPINSVIFHRDLYEQCGGFDTELENLEDWNLWLRFCATGVRFGFVDKTTAIFRVPMESDFYRDRKEKLLEYETLARKKNEDIIITTSAAAIKSDIENLLGEITEMQSALGIDPFLLRGVRKYYLRSRVLRSTVRILRPVFRTILKTMGI